MKKEVVHRVKGETYNDLWTECGLDSSKNRFNYSSESGSFNNCLSRLNSLGVIQKKGNRIKINPELREL